MTLHRRIERLETLSAPNGWRLDPEDLRAMSGEELETLEEAVEEKVVSGERSFWDLYAVVSIKSQRATERVFTAIEASGREPRTPERTPEQTQAACKEALARTSNVKNGYRIWRYYRGEKMPEELRTKLYGNHQQEKGT